MENQELVTYIKQSLAQSVPEADIRSALRSQGWQEQDIKTAFQAATPVSFPLSKKSLWKKIVLITLGLLGLLVVFVVLFPRIATLVTSDIAPIDDSDLQLAKVYVPDNENAYFDLIKLDKVTYWPDEKSTILSDMVDGKVWDEALAKDVIARNEEALKYFSDAARKPKFQDPAVADPANISPNTPIPLMSSWRTASRVSALRAQYLASQGRGEDALAEAFNSIQIGQTIEEPQSSLIGYLVGMAIKDIGLKHMQLVINVSSLNSTELSGYSKDLERFYENEKGLTAAFKGEYKMRSWALDAIASGNMEPDLIGSEADFNPTFSKKDRNNFYFRKNETQALDAESTRSQIKNVGKSCQEETIVDIKQIAPHSFAQAYVTENAVGKILYKVMAVDLVTPLRKKRCDEKFLVAATQAMLGIKSFKNDTGNYPQSLSELAPKYLTSVPIDPYDGKQIKYSREKKLIYSIGSDKKDSGGSAGDDWHAMADPTFPINF